MEQPARGCSRPARRSKGPTDVPPVSHRQLSRDHRVRRATDPAHCVQDLHRSWQGCAGCRGLRDRPAHDAVRVEQNCLLLETGGKRVLFDNGLGSEKLYGPDSGKLLASLAEAGVEPASIDAMVLTHAHSDHCWGTMGDDGAPISPMPCCIFQAPMSYWQSNPPGERRQRSIAGVRKHLLPLRDRMRFIRDGEEFLPGVQAWFTPGHTPGHMAFLFSGGWCLTGDVAFHDPISYAFPEAESAFDVDPQLAVATPARSTPSMPKRTSRRRRSNLWISTRSTSRTRRSHGGAARRGQTSGRDQTRVRFVRRAQAAPSNHRSGRP